MKYLLAVNQPLNTCHISADLYKCSIFTISFFSLWFVAGTSCHNSYSPWIFRLTDLLSI